MIMAGGTGGHVFPALAVAEYLRDMGCDVSWLGVPDSFEARVVPKNGFKIDWIEARRLRGQGIKQLVSAPFALTMAMWQAWKILRRNKPDVILGMGGFVTAPGGFVSWLMRLPLVVHEQNAVPGMSNKFLSKIAKRVLQAFPNSFPIDMNVEVTGNPIRSDITKLATPAVRFQDRTSCRVLIVGGSLGAKALNEIVPNAILKLKTKVEVRHQAGRGKFDETFAEYKAINVDANVVEFVDDMAEAYAWADVIICRAGALTVTELTMVGLPAILVPYPHAVDDHQTKNAEFLVSENAAIMIQQKNMTADTLAEILEPICASKEIRLAMAEAGRKLAMPDSASVVGDVCLSVVPA